MDPVVLGFCLGGKSGKAGVLLPPIFDAARLGQEKISHHLAAGYSGNIEALQKAATAAGHLYPFLDFDGITRRVPIFMRYGDGFYEALSLAMIRTYLGNAPAKITVESLGRFTGISTIPSIQVGD